MPRVHISCRVRVEWELLETVTMVLVAVEGNRACKLGPYDRARCTLVYLRKHDTLEQIVAGFRIGAATAWRYVNDTRAAQPVRTVVDGGPRGLSRRRIRAAGRHRRRDRPGTG
ncbi:helix-turn-helix domain-containing protein [Streptomyces sp. NPDC001139]